MKKTGELLRSAREQKRISLNEISMTLKINSKVLAAIEAGESEKLPAKIFIRGFVQSYAQYLKINVEEVLAVFNEETKAPTLSAQNSILAEQNSAATTEQQSQSSVPAPMVTTIQTSDEIVNNPSLSSTEQTRSHVRIGLWATLIFATGLLIVFISQTVEKYAKESQVITTELEVKPIDSAETAAVSEQKNEPASPQENAAVTVTEPPLTTSSDTKSSPYGDMTPPPTLNALKPSPNPLLSFLNVPLISQLEKNSERPATSASGAPQETQGVNPVTPPQASSTTSNPIPNPDTTQNSASDTNKTAEASATPAGKSIELVIETKAPLTVEFSTARGATQKISLGADQVHTLRSKNGLKVLLSDGGAASLSLNGKDLGTAGVSGKPAQLTY